MQKYSTVISEFQWSHKSSKNYTLRSSFSNDRHEDQHGTTEPWETILFYWASWITRLFRCFLSYRHWQSHANQLRSKPHVVLLSLRWAQRDIAFLPAWLIALVSGCCHCTSMTCSLQQIPAQQGEAEAQQMCEDRDYWIQQQLPSPRKFTCRVAGPSLRASP